MVTYFTMWRSSETLFLVLPEPSGEDYRFYGRNMLYGSIYQYSRAVATVTETSVESNQTKFPVANFFRDFAKIWKNFATG